MTQARHRPSARLAGALALGLPVLVGLAWMARQGAPPHFLATNAAALLAGLALVFFLRGPKADRARRALMLALVGLLVVPLLIGPQLTSLTLDTVARWLPLGPVPLHSGMLAVPALAVLAAQDDEYGVPLLLAALLAVFLQPDAASGFALTFAAVGLHHVTRDWKHGVVAIVGFVASIRMALTGEIEPQPFVEGVLVEAMRASWPFALFIFAAMAASYFLLLKALPASRAQSFALAGSLFGFAIMALMSSYPTLLVGYGAAPILGYGLAIGLVRREAP